MIEREILEKENVTALVFHKIWISTRIRGGSRIFFMKSDEILLEEKRRRQFCEKYFVESITPELKQVILERRDRKVTKMMKYGLYDLFNLISDLYEESLVEIK
jgi:hypothetical protein